MPCEQGIGRRTRDHPRSVPGQLRDWASEGMPARGARVDRQAAGWNPLKASATSAVLPAWSCARRLADGGLMRDIAESGAVEWGPALPDVTRARGSCCASTGVADAYRR